MENQPKANYDPDHNLENAERPALNLEVTPEVTWRKPEVVLELGEIFRTAEHLAETLEERTSIALRLFEAISRGEPEGLTDDIWSVLENTDSYSMSSFRLSPTSAIL